MCRPMASFWDPNIQGRCLAWTPWWYVGAGTNLLTDVIICVLPFPMLWQLRLPRPQKYALMAIFSMGGV